MSQVLWYLILTMLDQYSLIEQSLAFCDCYRIQLCLLDSHIRVSQRKSNPSFDPLSTLSWKLLHYWLMELAIGLAKYKPVAILKQFRHHK